MCIRTFYVVSASFLLLLVPPALTYKLPSPRTPRTFTHTSSSARRSFLTTTVPSLLLLTTPIASSALVPGALPPPPKKKVGGGEKTCKTIDECLEQREKQERLQADSAGAVEVFQENGVRYIRVEGGDEGTEGLRMGDETSVRFNVLKAGKRSADGLSGQGTSVFSMGYMLEDDEKPNSTFKFFTSDPTVIPALRSGVVGMKLKEVRRVQVLPEMGWRKANRGCDGGPGGSGAGGEVKTDYVIVPTAEIVDQEKARMDKNRSSSKTNET